MISASENQLPDASCELIDARIRFANSAIPFLKPVVTEIVQLTREHDSIRSRLEQIDLHRQLQGTEDLYSAETHAIEESADQLSDRLKLCYDELQQVQGVSFSSGKPSLVDFICDLDEGTIHLCWELGQEKVSFWHWSCEDCGSRRRFEDATDLSSGLDSMLA
jgi:hypothetical protein